MKPHAVGTLLCLLLLCSCETTPHSDALVQATELPADATINRDAGHGGYLTVMLRLQHGEAARFMLDTGATSTSFDKSFEPKLGQCLGAAQAMGWGGKGGKVNLYAAPKLYLGNTRLMTGDRVSTGTSILGMDCLKHYCIQLDFEAGKIRFLNPDQVNVDELGKAYPLTLRWNVPTIHHIGLLGESGTDLMIDTGCRVDGLENKSAIKGIAQFLPACVWDRETYTNLTIAAVDQGNVLGLSFLARHLVTLSFPKQTMYLKQTSIGPPPRDSSPARADSEIAAPAEFLERMKERGQLPGLSKDDKGAIYIKSYSDFDSSFKNGKGLNYARAYFNTSHQSVTFDFWKDGVSSIYHYQVARQSKNSPWDLKRAWLTDQDDHVIRDYPIPSSVEYDL